MAGEIEARERLKACNEGWEEMKDTIRRYQWVLKESKVRALK